MNKSLANCFIVGSCPCQENLLVIDRKMINDAGPLAAVMTTILIADWKKSFEENNKSRRPNRSCRPTWVLYSPRDFKEKYKITYKQQKVILEYFVDGGMFVFDINIYGKRVYTVNVDSLFSYFGFALNYWLEKNNPQPHYKEDCLKNCKGKEWVIKNAR